MFRFLEHLDFLKFDPMFRCSFLWGFRRKAFESHNSKQMTVHEQLTFLLTVIIFSFYRKPIL